MRILLFFSISLLVFFSSKERKSYSLNNFDLGHLNAVINTASINRFDAQPTLEAQIERYGRIDGISIGYGGRKSEQYKRYEKLKLYNEKQLIKLTNFKSTVVRAYAFNALTERNSKYAFEIFKAHLNDTSSLKVLSGCIEYRVPLNAYFYGSIKQILSKEDKNKYAYLVNNFKIW